MPAALDPAAAVPRPASAPAPAGMPLPAALEPPRPEPLGPFIPEMPDGVVPAPPLMPPPPATAGVVRWSVGVFSLEHAKHALMATQVAHNEGRRIGAIAARVVEMSVRCVISRLNLAKCAMDEDSAIYASAGELTADDSSLPRRLELCSEQERFFSSPSSR